MGTAQRRLREVGERRRSILEAARKIFWARGYDGATMPQIASEAELAPGTLYLYFPSKEAIYVELLLEGYRQLEDRLSRAVSEKVQPRDQAAALVGAFFGFAQGNPEYFNIIFFLLQREGQGGWTARFSREQARGLDKHMDACKAIAAEVLSRANPKKTAEQIESLVDAVWSMLSGVIFYFKDDPKFPVVGEEAKRLVLKSLFVESE